jgi:hypothetical protein
VIFETERLLIRKLESSDIILRKEGFVFVSEKTCNNTDLLDKLFTINFTDEFFNFKHLYVSVLSAVKCVRTFFLFL